MEKRPKSVTIKSLFKAVRLQNLLILVFAQYFTVLFLTEPENYFQVLQDPNLFLLSLSTVLIAAGGYMINDYYDIKIDYVNRPDQVIVGRDISRRQAITIHTSFNFLGIVIGGYISPWIGLVNLISASLLWWYSNFLKRQPLVGNISIGVLSGAAILIVALLYPGSLKLIAMYSFFAGFFSMIREIIKDIEDKDGDEKFGCKTLPIVWGIRKTKIVIYILLSIFCISFIGLSYKYLGTNWIWMSLALVILSGYFVYQLWYADTRKDYSKLSFICKLILFLGIVSMAFIT